MAIRLPIVSTFDKKGLDRAKRALKNFSSFAADVGKIAAGAVTAVAVAGVREASAFESSIAKIEGLVGVGGEQLDRLAQSARELGPEFGKSANEAADALFFITSAGLRGEGAINVLEASLKGAAIGLGDTKTIADLATSAVNAYGESNLDGAQAVDVLTEAVRLGKLEPAELAGAMGQVLPLASNLGVSFDQVGAALAGMSKTGTDASTASTQLRQILATIAKPTNEAETALAEMGLSAEGLREQIREEGLYATLETLTDAFDGNIEATSEVFGNIRALSGVLDLMGASAEDNREVFAQLADGTGVLDEAFGIASETAEFKFNQAMGTTKEILLGIGEDLIERLLPHLDSFKTFMDENGPLIETIFDNIFQVVENVAIGVSDFIDDLVGDESFQEFLANLQQWFIDTWPQVEELIGQLADLALQLTPLLTDAIEEALPILQDLVSIADDLMFFINEGTTALENMGIELPEWAGAIERAINPVKSLKDVVNALAGALNAAREAYESWLDAGAPSLDIDENKISGTGRFGLGGQRAMGGLVTGGSMYAVGERGPELFIPNENGMIVPNNQIGATTNYNISVQAGVGDPVRIGEEVVTAIKRYERVSGPVFASA